MELKTLAFNPLQEALDSPYPFSWYENTDKEGKALFESANTKITVNIINMQGHGDIRYYKDPKDPTSILHIHEILFYESNKEFVAPQKWKLNNRGDAFRIMATVIKITEEYVNKHYNKIDALGFLASSSERGRLALYSRLFKSYTPKGKWAKDTWAANGENNFIMYKVK